MDSLIFPYFCSLSNISDLIFFIIYVVLQCSFTVKNGSFTGTPLTMGIGPASADLNDGSYLTGTWYCWPLITIHLFYAITLVFRVL